MVHKPILGPKVLIRQALIVTSIKGTIVSMLNEKEAFTKRLNLALDRSDLGVPAKGKGRQTYVGKLFHVGQKAARKWLEGDGFPKLEQCIYIAKETKVSFEWLMTGRGEMRMLEQVQEAIGRTTAIADMLLRMDADAQSEWINYGEYLLKKADKGPKRLPSPATIKQL